MDRKNNSTRIPYPAANAFRKRESTGNFLRAIPGTESENASPIYRSSEYDDTAYAVATARYDGPNFYATLQRCCKERADSIVVSFRPVECVQTEMITDAISGKSKPMEITYFHPTVTLTYSQLWERIEAFGIGLARLGLRHRSIVSIYQDTCVEWLLSIYGIWSQNMIAATVYANLGKAALSYALHETASEAIICSGGNVVHLVRLVSSGVIPSVPLIHIGAVPEEVDTRGVDLYSFEEVIQLGRSGVSAAVGCGPKNPDDLALIMYTSGTTGDPKGVMHTHGSLATGAGCLTTRVEELLGPHQPGESYCAYLPMAHIMEFTIITILVVRGFQVGFGSPRTLTDATARPHGDLQEYKPSLLVGVPRVFDMLKKAIEAKLPPVGSLKRRVFDHAFHSRRASLQMGQDTPYWNNRIFGAARAALGGRVRVMLGGGGPLSAATQDFVNVVLGNLVAGYGMTESVCVGAIQLTGDWETQVAGLIEPGEEIKLLDTDAYKHTDAPEARGELLLRGKFLFKGYFKQPEVTKESLDEEGWFHTGDVASISSGGKIRIVGRVKALAKNALGEYIALEMLEAVYGVNALLLPNSVCVLVHPNRGYITAIGLTDEAKALAFAKQHHIEGTFPTILDSPAFQKAAAASLAQTAMEANRKPFECVRHVRILNDEWSPENEMLTAAMKLKRRAIDEHYAKTIEQLFSDE